VSGTGQVTSGEIGDQFYVTHCVTADSVTNSPGYSVRATSAMGNADAFRLALEYPPYELPLELWREKPGKAMAPRRLARTPHSQGGIWVVHSVYLEKDTMNRDRSYFSHLIQLPASTSPAAILRSWDAPGWIKEYPTKADKNLPRTRLPIGTAISDEALATFLSSPETGPGDLAVVVCPVRLRSDAPLRRELLLRFLQGVLLANREGTERDRLFVHAEPGLVAMLLYAAVRILPPTWIADLTFSTFEPAHRGLRDYNLAAVIGTYAGPAGKGLDPDLVSSHGYGLDTFRPERSSREFSGTFPPGLDELIKLVANGEWELLAEVQRLIGNENDALGRVTKMIPLARAAARLNSGEPTIDDLLILRADSRGATALTQRAERIWPHVRAGAMADSRIRTAFKDWLAEPAKLDEFRREAAKALLKNDLAGWDTRWGVVRDVADAEGAKVQLEKAIKNLDEHLPNLPAAIRSRLREACAAVGVWPDHHLLAPISEEELTILLSPQSPAEWQGYACFTIMGPEEKNWLLPATAPFRPAFRGRAQRHLMSASPTVLAGYLKHSRPYISSDPVFLYNLIQPYSKTSAPFLDRLIDAGAAIVEAADWVKLLSDLNVYNAPEWQGFLFQNDHLAKLLAGFRANPAAKKVWSDYLDLLSAELFDGDEWEHKLYDQLKKAKQSLGAAGIPLRSVVPEGGSAKLNAIDILLAVFTNPKSAAGLGPGDLFKACQAIWPADPLAGLRKLYFMGNFDKLNLPRDTQHLDPFIAAFLSCFPITNDYFAIRTSVAFWLELSESCLPETRVEFQVNFVRKCVGRDWYRSILDENWRVPFLPEADARIREFLALPATTPIERFAQPSNGSTSRAGGDAPFSSEATKRARKLQGRTGDSARRQRSKGISGGVWAVVVVGIIAFLVLGAAVVKKFGSGETKPLESDVPAAPKIK
jgi:hypothetical protein